MGKKKKRKGPWEAWNATGVLTDRIFSKPPQHVEPKTCPCGDGDAEARRGSASFTGRRAIATTPLWRRSEEAAKGPLQGLAPVGIFANRVFPESPIIENFKHVHVETETQKRTREGPAKNQAEPCPEQDEAMLSTAACPPVRPGSLQHTVAEG